MEKYFLRHIIQCFLLLVASGTLLAVISINLTRLVVANLSFIVDDFSFAIQSGALAQTVQLVFYSFAAMACYIIFKFCENILISYLKKLFSK